MRDKLVNTMIDSTIDALAKTIWEYHLMHHHLQTADAILVLGSNDVRAAERGAQLFLEGWAPLLTSSGGVGRFTGELYDRSEADEFARIAVDLGVPIDSILIENQSTNTGDNIRYTHDLMMRQGLCPRRIIVVHKPYMERRSYATFKKVRPKPQIFLTSPQVSFEDYPTDSFPKTELIHAIVGDLQRVKLYGENGFQIPQMIPDYVWQAYQDLVLIGFDKYVVAQAGHEIQPLGGG